MADELGSGVLAVCLPFLLDAGSSARGTGRYATLLDDYPKVPYVPITEEAERRAVGAQAQLAQDGCDSMSAARILVSAIADCCGLGVLHYDNDFDVLLERTGLDFHSEWLMPRGSLN